MTFFGLKLGQDLKNWVAHPCQQFLGVPPPLGIIVIPYEVRYDILTIHNDRDVAKEKLNRLFH